MALLLSQLLPLFFGRGPGVAVMSLPDVRDVKAVDSGDAAVVIEEDANVRRTATW